MFFREFPHPPSPPQSDFSGKGYCGVKWKMSGPESQCYCASVTLDKSLTALDLRPPVYKMGGGVTRCENGT